MEEEEAMGLEAQHEQGWRAATGEMGEVCSSVSLVHGRGDGFLGLHTPTPCRALRLEQQGGVTARPYTSWGGSLQPPLRLGGSQRSWGPHT